MLGTKLRLRTKADFNKCYSRGRSARGRYITARFLTNNKPHIRIGVVVSKKISKHAVIRNKIRRRIFSIVRTELDNKKSLDIVIIAGRHSQEVSYDMLASDIKKTLGFVSK